MTKATPFIDTAKGYLALLAQELAAVYRKRIPASREPRHLMLLAPFLPPFTNGGVYRPMSWVQHAAENNWKISVLTRPFDGPETESGRYLADQMPSGINIGFARTLPLKPSWKFFPRVDGDFLSALGSVNVGLELVGYQPPSVILATGPKFDFFITAFYLAKMFGSKLVLDYRDEWTQNPFSFVQCGNSDRF